jgi:ankyrin repeat protein
LPVVALALARGTIAAPPPQVAPVLQLVRAGDLAGLKAALAADPASANLDGPAGMTPLGFALNLKNVEVVRVLLEGGADPNKPFGQARTHPLQTAVARSLTEAVDLLLARGADVNGKDAIGGTALHEAAKNELVEVASRLAGKAADVNVAYTGGPDAGATPIHFAAKHNNVPLMIVLGAHQPNWTLEWKGRTPAEIADDAGAKDVAAYIRAKQAGGK